MGTLLVLIDYHLMRWVVLSSRYSNDARFFNLIFKLVLRAFSVFCFSVMVTMFLFMFCHVWFPFLRFWSMPFMFSFYYGKGITLLRVLIMWIIFVFNVFWQNFTIDLSSPNSLRNFFKFPIRKYLELIEGRLIDKKDDISNSRWVEFTAASFCSVSFRFSWQKDRTLFDWVS